MRKRNKIIVGATIGTIIFVALFFAITFTPTFVSHTGTIVFYGTPLAAGYDTTDYDAGGALTFVDRGGTPLEGAFTLGTDTESDYPYTSGDLIYFLWASTTANAWDRWIVPVELPFANFYQNDFYKVTWVAGDPGHWVVDCFLAIENQPTLLGYLPSGTVWSATGTNSYDLSDNNYVISGTLKIQVGANYGGLAAYWDPEEEANGIMDNIVISCDSNITAANVGFKMDYGGWKICDDGEGWYIIVNLPKVLGDCSYLLRWDEQQQHGVLEIPWSLTATVLDTATTTNDCELTFTLRAAQDETDCMQESWDTDETNFSAGPTAEVVDITV